MPFHKQFVTFVTLWAILLAGPVAANEKEAQAKALLTDLLATAVDTLKNNDGSLLEREQAFHKAVREQFDFSFISTLVVGKFWETMLLEQKEEFQELFTNFYLRSYAPLLGGYPGENIELVKTRQIGSSDVVVATLLSRPKRQNARTEWRFREIAGQLRIIDIVISGSSVGFSHRFDFINRLEKKGIEGLLTLLRLREERALAQP